MRLTLKYLSTILVLMLIMANKSFAGIEPYENFIKGKLKKNDSLFVKDEKFKNPAFNWSEITNISVRNTISLRILDEQAMDKNFSVKLKVRVEYFSDPLQVEPTKIDSLNLNVNYVKGGTTPYQILDYKEFENGHYVKVYVIDVYSPEYGAEIPPVLQLTNSIVIDRQYLFKPFLSLGFNGDIIAENQPKSGGLMAKFSGGTPTNSTYQLKLTWPITSAQEYDIEWATVDMDGQWKTLADSVVTNKNPADARLGDLFKNNATRVTTHEHEYLISLMFNANLLLVRMRQVTYNTDGLRIEGDWDYRLNTSGYPIAHFDLTWHQSNLNWQYSSAYAEEGKKKELVSYFDGSLRGRQTVTVNNSDNVTVVQENIYDQFGRAAASILPAPVKINIGSTPEYLHYFSNFNRNNAGAPYNFANLNSADCEPLPAVLGTTSGASKYYSPQNQFKADAAYLSLHPEINYLPNADGYPLSVTQYTADNTGRIKIQGGVGATFQPGTTDSRTTKYFYGKPEQWELDTLFGNDVGYAKHYLKNMVIDPNGQISLSYLNASGKTIATALAGKSPENLDKLNSVPTINKKNMPILKPDQFVYSSTELKLTATTTYMASVPDTATLTYDVEHLISRYPGGVWKTCSNCYYELTITVKDDCQAIVYQNGGVIQIGSAVSDSTFVQTLAAGIPVPLKKVGEYYITFELALSKKVIDDYTDAHVTEGQAKGHLKKQSNFVKDYLLNTRFEDCFSDCKTARKKLGTESAFVAMFNAKLDSLGEDHALYATEIATIYAGLLTKVSALEVGCNPNICDLSKIAMLEDVSPGGQFALFGPDYSVQEAATNILDLFFKKGIFNDLADTNPLYQANLVTLDDGTITSPYAAGFTLTQLVKYWKPEWAEKFLVEHPEYCKLEFCSQNSVSNAWDEKITNIEDPADLYKVTTGLTYNNASAIWLLNDDPFFKSTGKGADYYALMYADLENYSRDWLKVNSFTTSSTTAYTTAAVKSISKMIDYLLYCADPDATTHTVVTDRWTNCTVNESCRIPAREWELLRSMYLELKGKYIALARSASNCKNVCEVGKPISATTLAVAPACSVVLNLGASGLQLASNQFSEANYYAGTQNTYTFVSGTAGVSPDLNAYCTGGTGTATFYPCIKVYLYGSTTPIFFTNVWKITCTTSLGPSCTGLSGYLYATYRADPQTFVVTGGSTIDSYTVYTGLTASTPPTTSCTGLSELVFYDCYTIYVGTTAYNYTNVWIATCITSTGGGGDPDPCDVPYQMKTAIVANTATATASKSSGESTNIVVPPPCEEYLQLMAAKGSNEQITAAYYDQAIYSVLTTEGTSKLKMTKTPATKKGFSAYEFKESFALQTTSRAFIVKKNVWVATYLPDSNSKRAKQLGVLSKMSSSKTKSMAKTGESVVLAKFEGSSNCVVLSDELAGHNEVVCNGQNLFDEVRLVNILLTDGLGNPVLATSPITVTIAFGISAYGYSGGGFTSDLIIPIGQSSAYIMYNSVSWQDYSLGSCLADQVTYSCVSAISGAQFCESYTNCTGTVITPTNPCPANFVDKISRFDKVKYDVAPVVAIDTAQAHADYNASVAQIVSDNCQGNADTWMENLKPGLDANGYDAATISLLRTKLIELCQKGGDDKHPMGSSTLNTGVVMVGSAYCYSFGDVIKAVLGTTFTNTLNPWLLDTPYPYATKHVVTEMIVSNTSTEICNQLTTLNTGSWSIANVGLFHNYLVGRFGTAMTLTVTELEMLMKSCNNCRFLLPKAIKLPVFLQATSDQCKTKTEVQAAIATMNTEFSGTILSSWSNYETIVSNYLNHKFGYSFPYYRYAELLASSSGSTQLCNEPPYTSFEEDPYACAKSLIEIAVGNGTRDYLVYIAEEREKFRNAYINTCAAAKANARLEAKQQVYHYTLYYYDLAGNLVRTVPPEGVSFLTAAEMVQAQKSRDFNAASCTYNGPTSNAVKATALQNLSDVLANTGNNAVEMWVYSNNVSGRQFIAATPDMKYMLQACINGNKVSVDVFSLNQTASSNVSFTLSNHVTADITALNPIPAWMHVVVQGTNLASGALQIWVNGVQYSPVTGAPSAGCEWGVGGNPVVMPENLGTLKHLRLYSRFMTGPEIASNANSGCFNAADPSNMAWYRFNMPTEPGAATTIAYNSTNETQYSGVYPLHGLATTYAYNSTNQVTEQKTPDAGSSLFWYDKLSRLVVSQNAKQQPLNNYSYTLYDVLGRITEVGQRNTAYNIGLPNYLSESTISAFRTAAGTNSQLTQTLYDEQPAVTGGIPSGLTLNNLRKRVAASIYRETPSSTNINASYYSYDVTGNVKKLYQQVDGLGVKKLQYEYDLVSGKVNFLAYQQGENDQFFYQYKYDAENRLTEAWSAVQATLSSTGFGSTLTDPYKKMDASYQYYLHGPLARVELGDVTGKVQGTDYAYTLQGWLKMVNGTSLDPTKDMGNDVAKNTAKNALAYSLGYYNGDFAPIGGSVANAQVHTYVASNSDASGKSLYNGNIGNSTYAIGEINSGTPMGYSYNYDQLNRIKNMWQHDIGPGNWGYANKINAYNESFSYDGNGNILGLNRKKAGGADMDNLSYAYNRDAQGKLLDNRLNRVTDAATSSDPGELVGTNSYGYDAIGNLTTDNVAGITNIDWSVYGKIKQINKTTGNITYTYDPTGNRVSKTYNGLSTYYLRDAQGNSLAVYDNASGTSNWREQQLYGSSRLGMWKPDVNLATTSGSARWSTAGLKFFELSNHLGNVNVVINDVRTPESGAYKPTIINANDYFAFGGQMKDRAFTNAGATAYRYGFNGKENDNEVKGEGNQQDYGMRIYDPRIAKFLSVDPITKNYPELTPFQFASNNPSTFIDLDGLEKAKPKGQEDYLIIFLNSIQDNINDQIYNIGSYLEKRTLKQVDADIQRVFEHALKNPDKVISGISKSIQKQSDKAVNDGLTLLYYVATSQHKKTAKLGGEVVAEYGPMIFFPEEKGIQYLEKEALTYSSVFKGGAKGELLSGKGILEGNHLPTMNGLTQAGLNVAYKEGSALQMILLEHRQFISTGSGAAARAFRATEANLLREGKFMEAFDLNAVSIRGQYGNKYDGALKEARDYYEQKIVPKLKEQQKRNK